MIISRRQTLILAAAASAASVAGLGTARADDPVVTIDPAKLMAPAGLPDHVLGNKASKVTVIEYGSATCPHCGRFHHDVYPLLKSKYIDNGKIQFIFRPFALNVFDVVVFMLAEIAGPDHFYNVIDTFYDNQDKWVSSDKPKDAIEAIALQLGFTADSFNQALTNQEIPKEIQAARDQAVNDFQVSGTPTFFINGKQFVGEQTIDQLTAAIDPLLA
ncbi:MAG TPA: DsbA family protein [Devosiaceae bacterium]|nr:DsbA family protein [Devosiaceae bacterium]